MRGIDSPDIRAEIMRRFAAGDHYVSDGDMAEYFGIDRIRDVLATFAAMLLDGKVEHTPRLPGTSGLAYYTLAEDGARGEG